jgi:hypothetical protein
VQFRLLVHREADSRRNVRSGAEAHSIEKLAPIRTINIVLIVDSPYNRCTSILLV